MRHHTTADSIKIEGDEDGFHLIVETEGGDHFNFRIHHLAQEFAEHVDQEIGAWWREGKRVGQMPRVTEADLDAYELNDPKRVELQRAIDRGGW